ncbi:diguanylate cyclase [Deinococcus sp. QL22]|uniref:GGDEF domain-containing protein n=1 Tax=Deinococcus sp. QL22 TaxID=2939437 RepID=UPI002016DC74|nr:GGDEF domain-containing protein [Deinococcus sp. QL22]UQN10241.1 GGDEF domain-containing protein [Deinococcus sp. QL22]
MGGPSPIERQQRWMLTGVMVLAVLTEAGVAFLLAHDPQHADRLRSVLIGLAVTLVLTILTISGNLRPAHLQRLTVLLAAVWMLTNVHNVIVTHRPVTSGMLLHTVMLALLAFSWLPARPAIATVVLTFVALCWSASFSTAPDYAGLILLGFSLVLTWYLTRHGQEVTSERGRNAQLRKLAATDSLTGLLNRRAGVAHLEAMSVTWADQPEYLSVLMLDLDHFKQINDSMGHARGDDVLVAVARLLSEVTQPEDVLIRWGGEEFLIVLMGDNAMQSRETGRRILEAVCRLRLPDCPPLSLSGGLAFLSEAKDVRTLVTLADDRLYQAKAAGRDQLV